MTRTSQIATRSTPRRLYFLAALALAGLGISVSLTQHYYEVRNGTAGFKSFCNLGQAMNCDTVAASTYADFVAGFPLSSFAAGWFLALFVVALVARNVFWRREAMRVALGLTTIGLVFSLAYFWVMAGVIHSFCLFCLLTDAINIIAFATVVSLKPEGFSQHKPDLTKWKPLLGITVTSVFLLALGLKTLDASVVPNSSTDELAKTALGSPVLSVNAGPEFPFMGRADAPVTIVEFSDFQCPYCRIGAFTLNSVLAQHPNEVRVVFRNFPLDSGCNRKMDRPMHPYACDAAKHVICANKQGKFQAVYETLFENQATFAPGRIEALSQEAGTDAPQMAACLNAPETNLALSRDVEEAATLGIESTPTFFVNGHKIEGVQPPAVWDKIIGRLVQGTK